MNRLKLYFATLISIFPFFAHAADGFVYLSDTTQKLFFVSDNEIYTPDKSQLLYSLRGNIFYTSNGDSKDNISLLVTSLDPASSKLEMMYEKDQRQPVYSFRDNRFFLGKAGSEESQQKNELIHIESSKKWLGFYASDNDSLLAYYRIDSFLPATAIIVAYTIIKKFKLDAKVAAQKPPPLERGLLSIFKVTPQQQQIPSLTGAYATLKPASGNTVANEWMWDGDVLRPRWNTNPDLRWTFDGQTVKKKYDDPNNEQYTWDGKTFKPAQGDDPSQQWNWDGNSMKRGDNSDGHSEYIINDGLVQPISNPSAENEWYMDGTIPIPLIILIISGAAKAE